MKTPLLASLLFLCACATSYQPSGFSGGYSDMKVGDDLYQVSFAGNGYTRSSTVQQHMLRRCAELTREKGFDYFSFVSDEADSSVSIANFGSTNGYNPVLVTKPSRNGLIKLFKRGTQPQMAFDAKEVLKSMGAPDPMELPVEVRSAASDTSP